MLLVTENPPEALIAEARQRQRDRHRRRTVILGAPARIRELYGEAAFPPGQHA